VPSPTLSFLDVGGGVEAGPMAGADARGAAPPPPKVEPEQPLLLAKVAQVFEERAAYFEKVVRGLGGVGREPTFPQRRALVRQLRTIFERDRFIPTPLRVGPDLPRRPARATATACVPHHRARTTCPRSPPIAPAPLSPRPHDHERFPVQAAIEEQFRYVYNYSAPGESCEVDDTVGTQELQAWLRRSINHFRGKAERVEELLLRQKREGEAARRGQAEGAAAYAAGAYARSVELYGAALASAQLAHEGALIGRLRMGWSAASEALEAQRRAEEEAAAAEARRRRQEAEAEQRRLWEARLAAEAAGAEEAGRRRVAAEGAGGAGWLAGRPAGCVRAGLGVGRAGLTSSSEI
jgi:hypothetical protein